MRSKTSGAPRGTLPLRYRLPNPPPMFVGRQAEGRRLHEAIERAPVSVVWGLGGLGKTSLVLQTLHRGWPEQAERTLFIRVEPEAPAHQVKLEIVRALALARRAEGVSYERLLADPELLLGMAIDVAEDARLWIVLDDLHNVAPAVAHELLGDLQRYARASRWIATSRVDPRHPELAGQLVALAPMDQAELLELANACAPQLREQTQQDAVVAAGGSPWRLRQIVGAGGAKARDADLHAHLLQGLPPETRPLLELLAAVEVALPAETIAQLAPLPDAQMLGELERRGFLTSFGDGHRLHDTARTLLRAALGGPVIAQAAARASQILGETQDPALGLELLRLQLGSGELLAAAAWLDRRGEALLGAGYAPRLWQLLQPLAQPVLARWRLRAGVELGAPEVVSSLVPLEHPTPADELLWCRALLIAGKTREAAEHARALRKRIAGEPSARAIAFEAGLWEARALGLLGRHRDALLLVDSLSPDAPELRARCDAFAAECHAILGRYSETTRLAAETLARLPQLGPRAQAEVGNQLLGVFLMTGDLSAAGETLATLVGGDPVLFQSRETLLFRALLGVSLGQLEESRALFRQLGPLFAKATLPGLILEHGEIFRRFVAGEFTELRERIDRAWSEARAVGSPFFEDWCAIWRIYLAIVDASPTSELPVLRGDHPGMSATGDLLRLLHAARAGATGDGGAWPEALPPIWSSVLGGMIRAFWAIGREKPELAVSEIQESIQACQGLGYRQFELEQRAFACELDILRGAFGELLHSAAQLRGTAESAPSARFVCEAELYQAIADEPIFRPALLEQKAAQRTLAPMAARRAQALLGYAPQLDRVDAQLLDALRARAKPWRISTVWSGDQAQPSMVHAQGWGLDEHRSEAWLPDGRTVNFAQRPLMWSALRALANGGGAASLETLAKELWHVAEYHPLRDNGRIHTLISRIRRLLEIDPAQPKRLVTSADGYRFGEEPVRRLHAGEVKPLPGHAPE